MQIPIKKLKTGFEMPVYGLGTWKMGGGKTRDELNDDKADIEGIRTALDAGVTHIDTAEVYANGYSEILVGQAIEGYDRSKIFLVSKVQEKNMSYDGILNSCNQSLTRLKTNYLDLYLLHRFATNFPLKDSIRALDKLVADGLVKNIGVCNFSKERLAEAQSYTKNKIVCNQVHYNLLVREPEKTGLIKYCQENDVILEAYRPLEKGMLLDAGAAALEKIAKKYQKTKAQVAINWLIS